MPEEYFVITKEDVKTSPFDPAEYLNNQVSMQAFLTAAK